MAIVPARAQEDPEYRMEIGVGGGLMGYLGDFNGNLTKDLQPMASVVARYNFNPYYGLKFNVQTGKMKGSSADVKTYYPAFATKPYEFSNTLVGLDITLRIQLLAIWNRKRLQRSTAGGAVHLRRIGRHIRQHKERRQKKRLFGKRSDRYRTEI